jgi:two-component system, NarL family, nitrate/nitrite response regulator NarL
MDHAVGDGQVPGTFGATSLLTPRQREIFDLIVVGTSNKEIARELGLSQGTVKIHIAKLFRKLGVRRRGAVALAAANRGLRASYLISGAVVPQNDSSLPQILCSPASAA